MDNRLISVLVIVSIIVASAAIIGVLFPITGYTKHASLLNRAAFVKESKVKVRVINYKYGDVDNNIRLVICRIDNGENAVPRYQTVEFYTNELDFVPITAVEK